MTYLLKEFKKDYSNILKNFGIRRLKNGCAVLPDGRRRF